MDYWGDIVVHKLSEKRQQNICLKDHLKSQSGEKP